MVTIALALILIAALAALVWYGWTSVRSAGRADTSGCQGCPLAAECDGSGDDEPPRSPERPDGADHGR
jgi:hypothetical protein